MINISDRIGIDLCNIVNFSIKGKASIIVHKDITGNCQLWCIGTFAAIFNTGVTVSEIKELLTKAWEFADKKKILFIDIRSQYKNNFDKLIPKEYIMLESPYVSTNHTQMILYLINTTKNEYLNHL